MKIKHIYTKNVGPLDPDWSVDLTDAWTGEATPYVLLSGPNGSGKSIILRMIANLWTAAGSWLDNVKKPEQYAQHWLYQWKACAVVIEGILGNSNQTTGLFFGDQQVLDKLRQKHPDVEWYGRTIQYTSGGMLLRTSDSIKTISQVSPPTNWVKSWREARKRMLLTAEQTPVSNIIYLDAETRRWVEPRKSVGELSPDDYQNRWLSTYHASEKWSGQLESTLVNLKIVNQSRYEEVIRDMNAFLTNKEIDQQIHEGDQNRLRVLLKNDPEKWHRLDDLSAGERQVLIQIFTVSRWLEPGGIVLIDEPDMHLHPSLVRSLLARLEKIVSKRNGQLIITSHLPYVWERYESIGMRIRLGGNLDE